MQVMDLLHIQPKIITANQNTIQTYILCRFCEEHTHRYIINWPRVEIDRIQNQPLKIQNQPLKKAWTLQNS